MRRAATAKFPHSVQLFKFCQKVLQNNRDAKVKDQDIGSILGFNPSDCSHWKRGEKNIKSIFALSNLATELGVEQSLIHDLATGAINLDEAYFEHTESSTYKEILANVSQIPADKIQTVRERNLKFIEMIHSQCQFATPPLYLPEVIRIFKFVSTQQAEMIDKLSRILRVKPGQYSINYRKGDLKSQTRLSVTRDLARIIFEGEREQFAELGEKDPEVVDFERIHFMMNLLVPRSLLFKELSKIDARINIISELSAQFWVPKSLICLQLQDSLADLKPTSVQTATDDILPTTTIQSETITQS